MFKHETYSTIIPFAINIITCIITYNITMITITSSIITIQLTQCKDPGCPKPYHPMGCSQNHGPLLAIDYIATGT